jgi:hypothetical protein
LAGDVGEILIFDRKLSSSEEAKVVDHLSHKWGLADISNFTPSSIQGIKLWLDASDLSSAPSIWTDKSGNGNSPSAVGSPSITTNAQNGLSVLSFDVYNSEYYEASSSNIKNTDQTWIILAKPNSPGSNNNHGSASMLCYGLINGSQVDNKLWSIGAVNAGVFNGRFGKHGGPTGTTFSATDLSGAWQLFVVEIDRENDTFSTWHNGVLKDNAMVDPNDGVAEDAGFRIMRHSNSRGIKGDVAEIIALQSINYNTRLKIEGYLTKKWALSSILHEDHPYKLSTPPLFDNTPKFVEKPYLSGYTVNFSPSELGNLSYWLDADDATTITKDGSNKVSAWNDKSGNAKHATMATASRQPTYVASDSVLNGKPSIKTSSGSGKPGLDIPSSTQQEIFMVAYYNNGIDNNFNSYNTLFSGGGYDSEYRLMGHAGTDYGNTRQKL